MPSLIGMQSVTAKWIFISLTFWSMAVARTSHAQYEEQIVEEEGIVEPDSPPTQKPIDDPPLVSDEEMKALEKKLELGYERDKERHEEQERIEKIRNNMFNPMTPPSLVDIHESLSADIVDISEGVDTFFVNDRIIEGRNKTHVRLLNTSSSIEREGTDNNVDIRVRFRLPRLEDKIQVEVNSLNDSNTSDGDAATNVNAAQIANTNQRQDTTAGLSFFKDVLGIRSKFTAGVIFRDFAPYGRFRVSKNHVFNDKNNINFIADVFGDTEDRTGQRNTLYYDHSFNKRWLFRVFNESIYRHEFHTFETGHGLTLFHAINDRNSIAYTASISSINPQTSHAFYVSSYDLFPTYRYRIYKQHAFFDVIPRLSFPKKYEFETNWSLTIRLEIIFGSV